VSHDGYAAWSGVEIECYGASSPAARARLATGMRKAVKKVFLSYDRSGEKAAREISSVLQGAGFDVWDPGRETLPGSNLSIPCKTP